jgi:hypothetical protein
MDSLLLGDARCRILSAARRAMAVRVFPAGRDPSAVDVEADVGQWLRRNVIGLIRKQTEHAEKRRCRRVTGGGRVALGLMAQELAEAEHGADHHGKGHLRIANGEASDSNPGLQIAARAGNEPAGRVEERWPGSQGHLHEQRLAADEPTGEAEALGENLRGILEPCSELIEPPAQSLERLIDRRGEQRVTALEVVVEGAEPDIRALGDLQDRDVQLALDDELLRGPNQG